MAMTIKPYHTPVLLRESVDRLINDTNGIYVDVTFGGGGHTREVLSRLDVNGKLVAFDQDQDAVANLPDDSRFHFVPANFKFLKNHLRFMGIEKVDGVLADLGVSSHQFDVPERGFSIRSEAPLDMRMDRAAGLTAKKVINSYPEETLSRIFWEYGELRESRKIAAKIVSVRAEKPIETTGQLIEQILPLSHDPKQNRFLAKLFQALRIEVNAEMKALEAMLAQTAEVIKPGGRLVVISYHSLEDRMVKNTMRSGNTEGKLEKDFYGNPLRPFTPMPGMPVAPDEQEIENNSRARSAKLRVAIKNE
jgi:16S rRNA (cytosine1402-N4)-methyltransferase